MKEKMKVFKLYPMVVISFAILYFIYLWGWLNPSLYLIKGYREFFTDSYFFQELVGSFGGMTEYLARLFLQFYNYPFIAALLIVLSLLAVYCLLRRIFKSSRNHWIPFLPVLVLMLMHNDYGHAIKFNLDILVLCGSLFLVMASFQYHKVIVYVSYPLSLMVTLYISGLFAAITFMATLFLLMAFRKEKALFGLFAESVLMFFVAQYLFFLSSHNLSQEYTDITRIYAFRYYPFVLYASIIILPVLTHLASSRKKDSPREGALASLAIIPAVFVVLIAALNREERDSFYVQHYARNGNWEKTLERAKRCEYPDRNVVFYTNEALYHTGRMQHELFSYNQSFGSEGLLLAEISTFSEIVSNQQMFMQLGALSLSIIWGTEATNIYGANPYVLRNLVKAYLAGGYIREAKKTLNRLDQTLFQKNWTERYRQMANDTTLIRQDQELKRLQESQSPIAIVSRLSPLHNLFLLSRDSNMNKMAYDYLLIGMLLDYQMENFGRYVSRLKEFGYMEIPKVYLEGLVFYSLSAPSLPIDIREFTYDQQVLDRFAAFRTDLLLLERDSHKANKLLKERYGDTYWYYLLFGSNLDDEMKLDAFAKMTS